MKNLILAVFLGLTSTFAWAQTEAEKTPTEASFAKFDKTLNNFGIIEHHGDGTCTFTFTNTGKQALIVKNVSTSCGCTTPDYSKEPVAPGKKGFIKAKYDTNRVGPFEKTLTVIFMDDSQVRLTIKGNVKPSSPAPTN